MAVDMLISVTCILIFNHLSVRFIYIAGLSGPAKVIGKKSGDFFDFKN